VDRYFGVTETTNNTRAGSDMGEAIGGAADGSPPLQGEFFVCDFFEPLPKGDLGTMEHPVFSLATRPDRRMLEYTHNGVEVTVTPSVKGRATIHDKDILIFCISQLLAAINAGREVSRTLQLTAHDLLTATRRDTSGDGYRRLRDAFERLAGTRITTNITTGGVEVTQGFGLIEAWRSCAAPARAHGQRLGDAVGMALSCGFVKVRPERSAETIFACENRWSGGSTSWRASIADGRTSGASRSRCCTASPARPRPGGSSAPCCAR
jgi:hypothetical protein